MTVLTYCRGMPMFENRMCMRSKRMIVISDTYNVDIMFVGVNYMGMF